MPLYEARLHCVHPLCHRWPKLNKMVRCLVFAQAAESAPAAAVTELTHPDNRRCRECHRPIALKHMEIWQMDGNGNATEPLEYKEQAV